MKEQKHFDNSKKFKTTDIAWLIGYLVVILLGFKFIQYTDRPMLKNILIIVVSILITLWLLMLITVFFGKTNYKNGMYDFIIGEEGTYSLSRVQAVLWAITIISSQIGVIVALFLNHSDGINHSEFYYYQPVFSESSIWLLSLSLSSYIVVKSITVNQITKNPHAYKKKIKPQWSDLVVGTNGLDFSRCQMLIWTLIALLVYLSKCYYFSSHLINANHALIGQLFNNIYDEYSPKQIQDSTLPFVPYLPWTFVVLMGLSQGAYVGKKLVPTFKLDDVKEKKQLALQDTITELTIKQTIINNIINSTKNNVVSAMDKANIQNLQNEIMRTQQKIELIKEDIHDIDNYKNLLNA